MVLNPERSPSPKAGEFVSAWEAVACAQRTQAAHYRLIRQPDHARLSGELARQLAIPGMPSVTDEIVRGISLHDEGWADFDLGVARLQATPAHYSGDGIATDEHGKPLSFLDIKAGDFLRAWRGSIEAAQAVAPIAALVVSGHFYRLGRFGIGAGNYSQADTELVRQFVEQEVQRQQSLLRVEKRSPREIEYWTDVLQFCDLLSLYLCCGSRESVEFPQRIGPGGTTVRLRVDDGVNVLSPPAFVREAQLSLEAQVFPEAASARLNWRVR